MGATRPFCESCGKWAHKSRWRFTYSDADEGSVRRVKEASHFEDLLGPAPEIGRSRKEHTLEYSIRACPCGRMATLFVRHHRRKVGKDDKSTTDLQEGVLVGPSELTQLFDWAEKHDPSLREKRPKLDVTVVEQRPAEAKKLAPLPPAPAPGEEQPVSWRSNRSGGIEDLCVDIPYTKALRRRLELSDFLSAQEALDAQQDPLYAAFVAEACADWPGEPPRWLDDWERARPDSGWVPLIRGIHGVKWAWAARGGAFTVKPQRWAVFQQRLRVADEQLLRATEMMEQDPVAWTWLIYSAMGLQLPLEESMRRFKKAVKRSPQHRPAYSFLLQRLCEKWGGSHEKMFTFARRASSAAPAGSTVHVVIAEAHAERWSAHEREEGKEAERAYRERVDVRNEILEANARCFRAGAHKPGADTSRAQVWFAYALWKVGGREAAAEHLRAIGKSTPWPLFAPHIPGLRKHSVRTARRDCGVS